MIRPAGVHRELNGTHDDGAVVSLARTIRALRPHLPTELASPEALGRVCDAVEHAPAAVTGNVCFECRLSDSAPQVDLAFAVMDAESLAQVVGGRCADLPCPGSESSRDAWRRLKTLAQLWSTDQSVVDRALDGIALEYDGVRSPRREAAPAPPGVFLSFRSRWLRECPTWESRDLALKVLSSLLEARALPLVDDCVSACFDRLPGSASIPYIGFMTRGDAMTVRVCIMNMNFDAIEPYVRAATGSEWIRLGGVSTLNGFVTSKRGISVLHLDIDPKVGFLRRAGLEQRFSRLCQLRGNIDAEGQSLLKGLRDQGLCSAEKQAALLAWPGRGTALLPHSLPWSLISRRLNHVKLAIGPDGSIEAKAYLWALIDSYRAP